MEILKVSQVEDFLELLDADLVELLNHVQHRSPERAIELVSGCGGGAHVGHERIGH